MGYGWFGAMVATAPLFLFGLLYLNTYALEHVRFSETRVFIAVLMLLFMSKMHESRPANLAIIPAYIRDPRVRRLAGGIIATQVGEIGQMDRLIDDLERHPTPLSTPDLPPTGYVR
jgi:hypothetical protein